MKPPDLNGKVAISVERILVMLGVPVIVGLISWDLAATHNLAVQSAERFGRLESTLTEGIGPRITALEGDMVTLNRDRIHNPRHSARDDALARREDRDAFNAQIQTLQKRVENLETMWNRDWPQ